MYLGWNLKPKTNITLNPLKKLLKGNSSERERVRVREPFVLLVYLEEIRLLHCIFERVEIVKMLLWQKEGGCGLRLGLPSWTTTTLLYSLTLSHGPQIIIKRVRIRDCLAYSSAALQAFRDWTHRFNSSSEGETTTKQTNKKFKKAKIMQSPPLLFVSFLHPYES